MPTRGKTIERKFDTIEVGKSIGMIAIHLWQNYVSTESTRIESTPNEAQVIDGERIILFLRRLNPNRIPKLHLVFTADDLGRVSPREK